MTGKELGSALGRIPSGLFILTIRQGEIDTGMLASWVQQCSFTPPRVSVAIKPERVINACMCDGHQFVLNIVSTGAKHLVSHFAKGFEPHEPAFEGLKIHRQTTEGAVILVDALAYLRCSVVDRFKAGDHDLVIGEVLAGAMQGQGEPRVHLRKNGFHY